MNKWEHVRRKARAFNNEVCRASNKSHFEIDAAALVEGAAKLKGVRLTGLPGDHEWLRGSVARTEGDLILFNKDVEDWVALYNQAHELAHIDLGHGSRDCTAADVDYEAAEGKIPFGVHRVEGYGPQERIECEANIFAREFLLPCDILKEWFTEQELNASVIAEKSGLGMEVVCHQLAYSLLVPDIPVRDEGTDGEGVVLSLDDFQSSAARVTEGPQLIDAGPGTGKTRTLVGRVLYLLKQKVEPRNILVLTFSNKAADELRNRIGQFAPGHARVIRIETFHSFGLELLRKYGTALGLPAKPEIVDPTDSLFLLEKSLPELELDHYENLYEPAMYLGNILKAISRAKDENIGPDRYLELASIQKENASSPEAHEAADRLVEVAGVYHYYQNRLLDGKLLDLSDLICRSIELLRDNASIKQAVRQTHKHVLVDEYQDVNRASGLLLRELVGDGLNLWVVGDLRQSIHRWRGATTANIRKFNEDFPLAKPVITLGKNYRSKPGIVALFSELAPQMKASAGMEFTSWQTNRADDEVEVKFEIASDHEAEALGIASEIERLQGEKGIAFRDQAIVCRTHTTLARIAKVLEEENVPVLYLGDFFERPEIRDLLSLLSFVCEPDGRALIRVARFPEYSISLKDVTTLRSAAETQSVPFPQALSLAAEISEISDRGKEKFELLAGHLEGLGHGRSAWKTLTRYLFDKSRYLETPLSDQTVKGQQQRLAIYQLLQFVHSRLGVKEVEHVDPKLALLRYIRRLEIFGDEKQLRQSNEWADGIDAVRILTIHASKGLEFRAVFLPAVAKTYLPISKGYDPCPPPVGLMSEVNTDWQLEEEECLFFVAMSRARDYICLSRALRYGKLNRGPSDFLSFVSGSLTNASGNDAAWNQVRSAPENLNFPHPPYHVPDVFDLRLLEVYRRCPRKFFYENILGLGAKRDDTAYLQFHKCVHETLRWTQRERRAGRLVDDSSAAAFLDKTWAEKGPTEHYLNDKYRLSADRMVRSAIARLQPVGDRHFESHEIARPIGKIRLSFDQAEFEADGSQLVIQRFRTGRLTKSEANNSIYGLLHKAAAELGGDAGSEVQVRYLGHDVTMEVPLSAKQIETRLGHYDDAISGIVSGIFDPTPDDHECHRCPHYFICPAAESSE